MILPVDASQIFSNRCGGTISGTKATSLEDK